MSDKQADPKSGADHSSSLPDKRPLDGAEPPKRRLRIYLGTAGGLASVCLLMVFYKACHSIGYHGDDRLVAVSLQALAKDDAGQLQGVSAPSTQAAQTYYFSVSTTVPAWIIMAMVDHDERLSFTDQRFALMPGERRLVEDGEYAFVYEWQADDGVSAVCAVGYSSVEAQRSAEASGMLASELPSVSCIRF